MVGNFSGKASKYLFVILCIEKQGFITPSTINVTLTDAVVNIQIVFQLYIYYERFAVPIACLCVGEELSFWYASATDCYDLLLRIFSTMPIISVFVVESTS